MVVIIFYYVVLFFFGACAVTEIRPVTVNGVVYNSSEGYQYQEIPPSVDKEGASELIKSTTFMSAIHYHCAAQEALVSDHHKILYGTKSWTFPLQHVNLTLSYPPTNPDWRISKDFGSEEGGYIITAFKVLLYIDGERTKGYIMNGGILQESIQLTFECSSITSLSYEFSLYGLPKNSSLATDTQFIAGSHTEC